MNYSKFFSAVLASLIFATFFIIILLAITDAASNPRPRVSVCQEGFQYMKDKNGALWIVSHKGQALTCNQ